MKTQKKDLEIIAGMDGKIYIKHRKDGEAANLQTIPIEMEDVLFVARSMVLLKKEMES